MTNEIIAHKVKALLIEVSPLIEKYTAQTCPACSTVCCKQRRCIPDDHDILYLAALGEPLPVIDSERPPDGPCQFMGSRGCQKLRWLRPWRCTWYFCDPLLDALEVSPRKNVRYLSSLMQQIVDLRSSINIAD